MRNRSLAAIQPSAWMVSFFVLRGRFQRRVDVRLEQLCQCQLWQSRTHRRSEEQEAHLFLLGRHLLQANRFHSAGGIPTEIRLLRRCVRVVTLPPASCRISVHMPGVPTREEERRDIGLIRVRLLRRKNRQQLIPRISRWVRSRFNLGRTNRHCRDDSRVRHTWLDRIGRSLHLAGILT